MWLQQCIISSFKLTCYETDDFFEVDGNNINA